MTVTPDPKPEKRPKKPAVYRAFHRANLPCLHCGRRPVTAAHLLRGILREDVLEGLVPLCGGGGAGCHGAFDEHQAYTNDAGERVTPADVKQSVATWLASPAGKTRADYLIKKLGMFGAERYRQRLEEAR